MDCNYFAIHAVLKRIIGSSSIKLATFYRLLWNRKLNTAMDGSVHFIGEVYLFAFCFR